MKVMAFSFVALTAWAGSVAAEIVCTEAQFKAAFIESHVGFVPGRVGETATTEIKDIYECTNSTESLKVCSAVVKFNNSAYAPYDNTPFIVNLSSGGGPALSLRVYVPLTTNTRDRPASDTGTRREYVRSEEETDLYNQREYTKTESFGFHKQYNSGWYYVTERDKGRFKPEIVKLDERLNCKKVK